MDISTLTNLINALRRITGGKHLAGISWRTAAVDRRLNLSSLRFYNILVNFFSIII